MKRSSAATTFFASLALAASTFAIGSFAGVSAQAGDVTLPEIPNAVAVSNTGVVAASLLNERTIAVVDDANAITYVPVGCEPRGVAIAPDASLAWAVCAQDPHLYVINIATGGVSVAGIEAENADGLIYVPESKQIVVADASGAIIVVSADETQLYPVLARIPTPDFYPTRLAALSDASGVYAISLDGGLAYINLKRGSTQVLSLAGSDMFLVSLALSTSETTLYAGANPRRSSAQQTSAILALDLITGRIKQRFPVEYQIPAPSYVEIAVGHRNLTVGTGLPVMVDGQTTGVFNVALDSRGRMGAMSTVFPATEYVSAVARSFNDQHLAVTTVNRQVISQGISDSPYPKDLMIRGSLQKSQLVVTGTARGLRPGTSVTMHVRNMNKTKTSFVTQKVKATVDRRGAFTWKAKTKATHVRVFAKSDVTVSQTIDVKARR